MTCHGEIIALVSCVKSKQQKRAVAKDMYTSPLFRGMRRYAERVADRWFILSAKHGLLLPTRIIDPYEQTLVKAPATERRAWAQRVANAIEVASQPGSHLVILAGIAYCRDLVPRLQENYSIELPMQGMRMGLRLRWLKSRFSQVNFATEGRPHER
jgi:hypothetical protein